MNDISALVGANSDQGPHRPANEDAYWVSDASTPVDEYGALFIVADGVGGQRHGAEAAQQAVKVIKEVFYQERHGGASVPTALESAIQKANIAVYEEGQSRQSKMGCTVVTAVQHQDQLYIAHVGDARIYMLVDTRLRQLTRDDTWVQKQVDAGIITLEEAEKHEWRNVVTQVLGNKLEITVHQPKPKTLQPGNMFLLCTDGLHGVLSPEKLYHLMKNNRPQIAAEKLVLAAITADTKDNVTAVVVHATPTLIPQPIAKQAAKQPNTSQPPAWAKALIGVVVLLLIAAVAIRFWPSGDAELTGPASVENDVLATAVPLDPAQQQPTVITLATEAPSPLPPTPLPEVAPTSIPTDLPTVEAPPEATTPPTTVPLPTPLQLACVSTEGILFVWQDAQVQTDSCTQFAQEGYALGNGDQVRILDNNAISVNGPDESCIANNFIKIQSIERPEIEGWVIANEITPPLSDGSCAP